MIYLLCEGHGEPLALSNLVTRLWTDLQLPHIPIRTPAIRYPGISSERGLNKALSIIRNRSAISGLLVVADQEDICPKTSGPAMSMVLSDACLPFPASYHVMYREYETLFLPSLQTMAGKALIDDRGIKRKGIREGAIFVGNPEANRDAKGIISDFMQDGRRYKPTLDQLPLTRMIDFDKLRDSMLPCFGTLERCLRHLSENHHRQGVYPPPRPIS
jgi:hypothetical protein